MEEEEEEEKEEVEVEAWEGGTWVYIMFVLIEIGSFQIDN